MNMLPPNVPSIETGDNGITSASLINGASSDSKGTAVLNLDQGSGAAFRDLVARLAALEHQKGDDSSKETKTYVPMPVPMEPDEGFPNMFNDVPGMKRALEEQQQLYQRQEDLEEEVEKLKLEKKEYAIKESLWEQEQMKREQRRRKRKGIADPDISVSQGEEEIVAHPTIHGSR